MNWFDKLAQNHLEEAETLEEVKNEEEYITRLARVLKRGMVIGAFLAERITAAQLREHCEEIDREYSPE